MQDGDTDAGDDTADDVGFAQGGGAANDKGEEKALEESGRLVQGLFQGFVEMDVEFLGLVNVVANTGEKDVMQESLGQGGARRGEELGCFVAGVWSPRVGAGDGEERVPLRKGGQDLERLGELARLVP